MNKVLLIILSAFLVAFLIPERDIVSCDSPQAVSRCADGTCSTSTGSGTCSGHGGVVGSASGDSGDSGSSSDNPLIGEPAPNPPLPPELLTPQPIILPTPVQSAPAPQPAIVPNSGGALASSSVGALWPVAMLLLMVAAGIGRARK